MGKASILVVLTGMLSLLPSVAPANTQNADLGITRDRSWATVSPLRTQHVRYTVTNHGPATVLGILAKTAVPVPDTNLIMGVAPEAGCDATVTASGGASSVYWAIPYLHAGESRACSLSFRSTPTATAGTALVILGVSAADISDANGYNNFVSANVTHFAVDRPSDLSLTAKRIPGGILAPGTEQVLELRFRNDGSHTPETTYALSNGYMLSGPPNQGFTGYDLVPGPETPPCGYLRDAEMAAVFFVGIFLPQPLLPGTTQICRLRIVAAPDATQPATFNWTVLGSGGSVYDPVESNSTAVLDVAYGAAVATPVPLSRWSGLALVALLLGAAMVSLRSPTTERPGAHQP